MSLDEIAKRANVSRATVSRVLNNYPHVRPHIRDRVLQAVQETGYIPNAVARSLVTKRTNMIGLLLPQDARETFADPFFAILIPSIAEACTVHQRYLMLSMVTLNQEEGFYQSVLRGGHLDGVIVGVSMFDDPILPQLIQDGLPLVLLGRHPYYPQAHWVNIDNLQAASQAVSYLAAQGRQRIALVSLPASLVAGADRRDGYKRALLQAGLPIDQRLIIETNGSYQAGQAAMSQLLQLDQPPDAVFAANDPLALGVLHELQNAGLRAPDDVAVVGFDDQPSAAYASPPLTTVHQPINDLGFKTVELLLEAIDGQFSAPQHRILPTTLVRRASA